ncbi:hypothetical protein Ciccas_000684 [Cichlidogyrus casuarinus]|uniref:Uncharacterized protein n=1 Tax=Cichlidogyrus casuarinus TaxID=1844966 RepID=A0ABD2QND3_9PLAT
MSPVARTPIQEEEAKGDELKRTRHCTTPGNFNFFGKSTQSPRPEAMDRSMPSSLSSLLLQDLPIFHPLPGGVKRRNLQECGAHQMSLGQLLEQKDDFCSYVRPTASLNGKFAPSRNYSASAYRICCQVHLQIVLKR